MARKGQFKKGGGRVGGASRSRSPRRSKALVKYRTNTVTRYRTRNKSVARRARRRGGGGRGGVTAAKVAITAVALGALVGSQNMAPKQVTDFVAKIPGAKTFGNVAITGLALGAVGHFTNFGGRFRPWLRAAGAVGLVAAAIKLGTDNTGFKFVGDDDDDELMDVDAD